jgi:hypothetical protein
MTAQVVQMLASLSVLVGFTLAQTKMLSTTSGTYIVLNMVGASVLGIQAIILRQWGFALLEVSWALVSLIAFIAFIRKNLNSNRQARRDRNRHTSSLNTR